VLNSTGKSLSAFDSTSTVSKINNCSDMHSDRHFTAVLTESQRIHRLTGGAFDPTLAPLVKAWGFGQGHCPTSDTLAIDSLLNLVGINKVKVSGGIAAKANPAISMNFSAIAKGYGCDEIGRMLKRNGVENFLVEIGGEIAVAGKNPKGGDWRISIDRPIESNTEEIHISQMIIEVGECGIATSGNYRNYTEDNGRRLAHTISPATGRPVQTDVLSATIIAPSAMEADALATSCMVLGSKRSVALLDSLGLPALLVMSGSKTWVSDNMKPLVVK